jgi:hypothetical protein
LEVGCSVQSLQFVDACTDHGRPLELPPRSGLKYVGFADPSGGRHDAFTICIGHRQGSWQDATILLQNSSLRCEQAIIESD